MLYIPRWIPGISKVLLNLGHTEFPFWAPTSALVIPLSIEYSQRKEHSSFACFPSRILAPEAPTFAPAHTGMNVCRTVRSFDSTTQICAEINLPRSFCFGTSMVGSLFVQCADFPQRSPFATAEISGADCHYFARHSDRMRGIDWGKPGGDEPISVLSINILIESRTDHVGIK